MQNCGDDNFGPIVASNGCRWGLDFTLLFEDAFLVIAPCSIFIICSAIEILKLYRQSSTWRWNRIPKVRLVVALLLTVAHIVALVFWTLSRSQQVRTSIAAASLEVLSSLIICGLILARHGHSQRPSTLLSSFLGLKLLFSVVQIRTFSMMGTLRGVLIATTTATCLELLLLVAEYLTASSLHDTKAHANRPCSEQEMGILADSLMLWLLPLFRLGYKKKIEPEHLPIILESLRTSHNDSEVSKLWIQAKHERKHALALTTFWLARYTLMLQMLPRLCLLGFCMAQPFLIERFIQDVSSGINTSAYLFIAAFALIYIGIAISSTSYQILTVRTIIKMRGGLLTLIYSKTLQLSTTELDNSSAVSLITADVERISTAVEYVQNIWVDILQMGIATYILNTYISAVCVAGVIVALISSTAAGQLSKMIGPRQRTWFEAGRERIKSTTQALDEIKSIKWSGLESEVFSIVSGLRLDQISAQKRFRHIQIMMIFLGNFPATVTPFVVFLSFAITSLVSSGPPLPLAQAFGALSVISLLISPVGDIIGILPNFSASLNCFSSIQDYLLKPSLSAAESTNAENQTSTADDIVFQDSKAHSNGEKPEVLPRENQAINPGPSLYACYNKVSIGVQESTGCKTILSDLNLSIHVGHHTLVTGPTGCGKSTLLKSLLGETIPVSGQSFIQPGRTGYCAQSAWSMNATIKKNIIGPCAFNDLWYSKVLWACCLTEELDGFLQGDETIIGSKAGSLSGGQLARVALARAVYPRSPTVILDEPFSSLDSRTEERCVCRLFGPAGILANEKTTVVLASVSTKWSRYADQIITLGSQGNIIQNGHRKEPGPLESSGQETDGPRDKIDMAQDETENKANLEARNTGKGSSNVQQATVGPPLLRMKDMSLVPYYLKTMSLWMFLLLLLMMLAQVTFIALQPLWLNFWINFNITYPNQSIGYYFGIYFGFVFGGLFLLVLCACIFFLVLVPLSSQKLHDQLLETTLKAPLSFFNTTKVGTILSYFTQDLILVDMALPLALILALENGMSSLIQLILVSISTGYVAIAIPGILLALFLIQHVYLRTSKQVRLLDLAAKAPVYHHLTETISGISTIRSLSWQQYFTTKNHSLVDDSQTAYYVLLCIQKWLGLVLNLLVAGLAILLSSTIIALRDQVNPGLLGVSLVSVVGLGEKLSYFVTFWTTLETSLGAVSRIKSYTDDTPKLDTSTQADMSTDWPQQGDIQFVRLSAGYSQKAIIHEITCKIPRGQRIRIHGPSGSGKSSLMASLLRLIDYTEGTVLIDGQDISTISSKSLHRAIFAVPQSLCFVSKTIRSNLCSRIHQEVSDQELEQVLSSVSLWERISSLPDGLDTQWSRDLFSHGQRQLFAFAQALLSRCPIIVIDEISSYLDDETVTTIQRLLSTEFSGRTILMITHDLRQGFTFDRAIRLEAGRIFLDEMI